MLLTPSPLSQTVTPSRTPSSVTYFMDGPLAYSVRDRQLGSETLNIISLTPCEKLRVRMSDSQSEKLGVRMSYQLHI